jgi:hypothetical protein
VMRSESRRRRGRIGDVAMYKDSLVLYLNE